MIIADPDTLCASARGVLKELLSCTVNGRGSGEVARIAGASIRADVYLPNMATNDFLPKLGKDGITTALQDEKLLPRNTGKEMRAALVEHVGTGSWVHPAALFELTPVELAALEKRRAEDLTPVEVEPEVAAASNEACDVEGSDPDGEADSDLILPPTGTREQHLVI